MITILTGTCQGEKCILHYSRLQGRFPPRALSAPMTVLELFPGAAVTGVVASHLGLAAHYGHRASLGAGGGP